jgi:DNA mismatch repair protein MutL
MIQILPEALANQIAAGEVVQRPSSVVKELLENALDAGARAVHLNIEKAGKQLIQVIDTGCGMNPVDARLCFERHATSKIANLQDLFNILTFGFRGEAMASIGAVAQVTLRTRTADQEMGTEVTIEGGQFKGQQPVVLPATGTTVSVRNLFFNVPARRNFLKSNPVETKHILDEWLRVALARPDVEFTFTHNDERIHQLVAGTLTDRILKLYPAFRSGQLLSVAEEMGAARLWGVVGSPDTARKLRGDQFLFVNGRFVRSHFLHHAVSTGFQNSLPPDTHPFYTLYLELPPRHIDINIHPTKTEIKFDDEKLVYTLVQSAVRQAVGRTLQVPVPDPELKRQVPLLEALENSPLQVPSETIRQFHERKAFEQRNPLAGAFGPPHRPDPQPARPQDWHAVYRPLDIPAAVPRPPQPVLIPEGTGDAVPVILPVGQTYLVVVQPEGLLLLDPRAAWHRIVYEEFAHRRRHPAPTIQRLLFPHSLAMESSADSELLRQAQPAIRALGFELGFDSPPDTQVLGMPAELDTSDLQRVFDVVVGALRQFGELTEDVFHETALVASRSAAARYLFPKRPEDQLHLLTRWADCGKPTHTSDGKPISRLLTLQDLTNLLEN